MLYPVIIYLSSLISYKINWFNYSTQLLVSVKQRELKDRIKDSNEKKVK